MPIAIAATNEIATQVIAMRRDSLILAGLSMDMKRTRMCGMPKYPKPHAMHEARPIRLTAFPVAALVKSDCK